MKKPKKSILFDCLTSPIPKQVTVTNSNFKHSKNKHSKKSRNDNFHPKVLKDYKLYIKSKYWKNRRDRHFKKFGYGCVICGDKKSNVHHMYYGNFSNEREEDLVTLCRLHHEMFHEQYPTKKDMRLETNQFIIEQSEIESFPCICA